MKAKTETNRSFWAKCLWVFGTVSVIVGNAERAASWLAGETRNDFAVAFDTVADWFHRLPVLGTTAAQNTLTAAAFVAFGIATYVLLAARKTHQHPAPPPSPKTTAEAFRLPPANELIPAMLGLAPSPQLEIEFLPLNHLTNDPAGFVQTRMRVRNRGPGAVKGLRVRLRSVVPLKSGKKMLPYTTQFNDVPLKLVRPETARIINPGDSVEFLVSSIDPNAPNWFSFNCEERDYHLPRGKVNAAIVASGENALPDQKTFTVTATAKALTLLPYVEESNAAT